MEKGLEEILIHMFTQDVLVRMVEEMKIGWFGMLLLTIDEGYIWGMVGGTHHRQLCNNTVQDKGIKKLTIGVHHRMVFVERSRGKLIFDLTEVED